MGARARHEVLLPDPSRGCVSISASCFSSPFWSSSSFWEPAWQLDGGIRRRSPAWAEGLLFPADVRQGAGARDRLDAADARATPPRA